MRRGPKIVGFVGLYAPVCKPFSIAKRSAVSWRPQHSLHNILQETHPSPAVVVVIVPVPASFSFFPSFNSQGVIKKILSKWMPSPGRSEASARASELGYDNLLFPFMLLAAGLAAALGLALVEAFMGGKRR